MSISTDWPSKFHLMGLWSSSEVCVLELFLGLTGSKSLWVGPRNLYFERGQILMHTKNWENLFKVNLNILASKTKQHVRERSSVSMYRGKWRLQLLLHLIIRLHGQASHGKPGQRYMIEYTPYRHQCEITDSDLENLSFLSLRHQRFTCRCRCHCYPGL